MADFLTHLAERSLGLNTGVRPDLPPLFARVEPQAEAFRFALTESVQDSAPPPIPYRQAADSETPLTAAPQPEAPSALATGPEPSPAATIYASPHKPVFGHRPSVESTALQSALIRQLRQVLNPVENSAPETARLNRGFSRNPKEELAIASSPITANNPAEQISPAKTGSSTDSPRFSLPTENKTSKPVSAMPQYPDMSPCSAPPTSRPAESPVQVSIGRIEVRIVTPPSAPPMRPAQTRTAPHVSLEQYLRGRNGQR